MEFKVKTVVLFAVSFVTTSLLAQTDFTPTNSSVELEYEIVDRSPRTITCVSGEYNSPDHREWDSTYYFAHIIFPELTNQFNEELLSIRTLEIMKRENIQMAYIWRDKKSLWMLPFSYQSEEMSASYRKSHVGWVRDPKDERIRFTRVE